VNLAVHPLAIPDVRGAAPDPKKITEELCEFRRRMSESTARQDKWWEHDSTAEGMAAAVQAATEVYLRAGRQQLDLATAEDADLNTVSQQAFAERRFNFVGFGSTECRMALALARLRNSKGMLAESRAFAAYALQKVSSASGLRAEIQALLPQDGA
jgi:hypothetical protein